MVIYHQTVSNIVNPKYIPKTTFKILISKVQFFPINAFQSILNVLNPCNKYNLSTYQNSHQFEENIKNFHITASIINHWPFYDRKQSVTLPSAKLNFN